MDNMDEFSYDGEDYRHNDEQLLDEEDALLAEDNDVLEDGEVRDEIPSSPASPQPTRSKAVKKAVERQVQQQSNPSKPWKLHPVDGIPTFKRTRAFVCSLRSPATPINFGGDVDISLRTNNSSANFSLEQASTPVMSAASAIRTMANPTARQLNGKPHIRIENGQAHSAHQSQQQHGNGSSAQQSIGTSQPFRVQQQNRQQHVAINANENIGPKTPPILPPTRRARSNEDSPTDEVGSVKRSRMTANNGNGQQQAVLASNGKNGHRNVVTGARGRGLNLNSVELERNEEAMDLSRNGAIGNETQNLPPPSSPDQIDASLPDNGHFASDIRRPYKRRSTGIAELPEQQQQNVRPLGQQPTHQRSRDNHSRINDDRYGQGDNFRTPAAPGQRQFLRRMPSTAPAFNREIRPSGRIGTGSRPVQQHNRLGRTLSNESVFDQQNNRPTQGQRNKFSPDRAIRMPAARDLPIRQNGNIENNNYRAPNNPPNRTFQNANRKPNFAAYSAGRNNGSGNRDVRKNQPQQPNPASRNNGSENRDVRQHQQQPNPTSRNNGSENREHVRQYQQPVVAREEIPASFFFAVPALTRTNSARPEFVRPQQRERGENNSSERGNNNNRLGFVQFLNSILSFMGRRQQEQEPAMRGPRPQRAAADGRAPFNRRTGFRREEEEIADGPSESGYDRKRRFPRRQF